MKKKEFLNLVSMFLQDPEAIDAQAEYVTFSNAGFDYSLTLETSRDGALMCRDEGSDAMLPAMDWIVTRLARLDILAKAIKEYAGKQITKYIPVTCHEFDDGQLILRSDVVEELLSRIKGASRFATSVYYLTAEAGEGKSVAVYKLAYVAATEYLQRKQKWLFVPIELGGRPFMRFDEMILGALSKCYRYNACYLESFMELVKNGRIVLGLDGFEEMSVPGTEGDIVSSLATMLNDLDSQGQVVFSARTAYYNYSQMRSRSLFQGAPSHRDVNFYEFRLDKWSEEQFVSLMKAYGFEPGESKEAYRQCANVLGADHPILTRAVLVHSLVKNIYEEYVERNEDRVVAINAAIDGFRNVDGHEAVARFVEMLVARETRKWVSRDQTAAPILTVQEHMHLLMTIADEMWRADTESLRDDVLIELTEFVCEELGKSPSFTKQCKERIVDHALLSPEQTRFKKFCHVDFMQFFLGYSFSKRMLDDDSIQRISIDLDRKILPIVTLAECAREIIVAKRQRIISESLLSMVSGVSRVSCLSQNAASLLLLLHDKSEEPLVLRNLYCARAVLDSVSLNNISFVECCLEQFENSTLADSKVSFIQCDIPIFYLPAKCNLQAVSFDQKSIPSLLRRSLDGSLPDYSDPDTVGMILSKAGANVGLDYSADAKVDEEDSNVQLFFKVVRLFTSKTYITENLLKTKLGVNFPVFNNVLRDVMTESGILEASSARDGTNQSVFRLQASPQELDSYRTACRGAYDSLQKIVLSQRHPNFR